MSDPILSVEDLNKSFFGVQVLYDVSFDVPAGHVVGVVGENGSGKSTTMNIIGGVLQKDSGRVLFEGEEIRPRNAQEAQDLGIAFIHQELSLFANLTVEENMFLDHFPRYSKIVPFIDRRELRRRARASLDLIGLEVAPSTPISRLPQGERQLVEIGKALSRDARLIIFDEPTTSLTVNETERLFTIIGELRERDISVIYISHILGDVMRLCDDIVVLRDGEVVATERTADTTIERTVTQMVGRAIENLFPERDTTPQRTGAPALSLRNVAQPGIVKDISFDLYPGEVLGISGLMGSGRSEVARIIFGLDPYAQGTIEVAGRELKPGAPHSAMEAGIAFLTEDRRGEGLMMEASIRDNILLPSLPDQSSGWMRMLQPMKLGTVAREMAETVGTRAADLEHTLVRTLSGGNQQKVVIGKWLLTRPNVFILDEPTRGIDVGAKYEVYKIINELVAEGAAILFISSEIEELVAMADRIMVMARGETRGFFDRADFDREALMSAALWD